MHTRGVCCGVQPCCHRLGHDHRTNRDAATVTVVRATGRGARDFWADPPRANLGACVLMCTGNVSTNGNSQGKQQRKGAVSGGTAREDTSLDQALSKNHVVPHQAPFRERNECPAMQCFRPSPISTSGRAPASVGRAFVPDFPLARNSLVFRLTGLPANDKTKLRRQRRRWGCHRTTSWDIARSIGGCSGCRSLRVFSPIPPPRFLPCYTTDAQKQPARRRWTCTQR